MSLISSKASLIQHFQKKRKSLGQVDEHLDHFFHIHTTQR